MKLHQWLPGEPFSLALSAGFFGFYAHCGFVRALYEKGHRPTRMMGSSAGALLASLVCAGHSIQEVEKILLKFSKEDFWDRGFGLGLLKGEKFKAILSDYLPQNFSDLKIPLTVAAHPIGSLQGRAFDEGSDLISAVHASCCFPGLFHPVQIGKRFFVDGGVSDWLGSKAADPKERILVHFLRPSGPHSAYIHLQVFRALKPQHHVVVLPGLKEMGPTLMGEGSEAIEESYQKTLRLL